MRAKDIKKGYYWVKFYNHEEKQIMLFNGKNFEGFKSDKFIHDEIESYEPIERRQNTDASDSKLPLCGVVGSTLTRVEKRELLDNEFYCSKCDTIHTKTAYAIAQGAMYVDLIFTCTCGNKIDL